MMSNSWTSPAAVPIEKCTCEIYALNDIGYDADLGKWIAETIPEVVEPETWKSTGALRFYAPKNVLVVRNSPAVQKKVVEFLKDMKMSLPCKGERVSAVPCKTGAAVTVIRAGHHEPRLMRTSAPLPEPSAYPVAPPIKAPKHLFHFIIRYEGEGIVDNNVVKFMKAWDHYEKGATAEKPKKETEEQSSEKKDKGGEP